MKTLTLNLKGRYFDEIKAGTKSEEYREYNDYWRKRLEGKTFDQIIVKKGYPAASDQERQIVRPWRGYKIVTITHEFFGGVPKTVFAIKVN